MNQEAHGGEVTRAFLENLHLPEFIINQMYINGAYYHPTFLYESLWNITRIYPVISLKKSEFTSWGNFPYLSDLVFDWPILYRRVKNR